MKNGIMAASLAGMLALAGVALAEPGPGGAERHGGPGGPGGPGGGLMALIQDEARAKELGLTDQQIAAAQEAARTHRKASIALRGNAELAQMELQDLMEDETSSREAVMKAVEKVGAAELALEKSKVELRLQLRDILGADTMKKIRSEMREERQDERGGPPDGRRGK